MEELRGKYIVEARFTSNLTAVYTLTIGKLCSFFASIAHFDNTEIR